MADEADSTHDEGNNKPMVWVGDDGVAHYRASAMGGCTTAMILVRGGFTAMAPPKAMQDRFDEGHLHEPNIVMRANTEFGLEVFGRQREVEVWVTPTVVITGHTDGEVAGLMEHEDLSDFPDGIVPERRLFEAKTMSDQAFKRWVKYATWEERWAAYPGYAKQLTLYLEGTGFEHWVYAVKNKESGKVIMEPGSGQPYPLAAIKAQVLSIEAHVRQGLAIPEHCHPKSQWPCPVYYVGPCGDEQRTTLDERVAEVVVELGRSYQAAKEAEQAAKATKEKARDEIKRHLAEGGKYEADGWKVTYSKGKSKGKVPVEGFNMEQFVADHPDLVEQYTTTEEVEQWSSDRLTVTPPKG